LFFDSSLDETFIIQGDNAFEISNALANTVGNEGILTGFSPSGCIARSPVDSKEIF
jgi:hypothetical protein